MVGSDTYQITLEPGIIITAPPCHQQRYPAAQSLQLRLMPVEPEGALIRSPRQAMTVKISR